MEETELKSDPKDYRKELWIGVAIAVAGAANTNNASSPYLWADKVLAAFDSRFGEQ